MSLVIILLTILFSYGLGYLQFVSMLDLYSWLLSQLQEGVHPVTFSPNDLVNLACHNLERANLVVLSIFVFRQFLCFVGFCVSSVFVFRQD